MGRFAFILATATLLSSGAHASSFVTLEAMKNPVGPSMVVIGSPAEPATMREETASGTQLSYPYPGSKPAALVAVGDKDAVSDETVSAIEGEPARPQREAHFSPMVIRGGIVGDAFVHSVAEAPLASAPASSETSASAQAPASEPAAAPQPGDAAVPSGAQPQGLPR